MNNSEQIKLALVQAIKSALEKHLNEHGTLKNLDWFNVSTSTTDFYDEINNKRSA